MNPRIGKITKPLTFIIRNLNNQNNKISKKSIIKYIQDCHWVINKSIYSFSNLKKTKENESINAKKQQKQEDNTIIQVKNKQNLAPALQQQQSSKQQIISRNYKQTEVPGAESRKYIELTTLQQEIIEQNKFDLLNPNITPKSSSKNTFIGNINENLTQISLGSVKIKDKNEVFLSEVDPNNIPDDLHIRFDSQKQLKIVGKQGTKQKKQNSNQQQGRQKQNKAEMAIQSQTIQQKSINEHFSEQFGMNVKGYKYNNWRNIRRWDIFLSVLFFAFIGPFFDTFLQLSQFYSSTKAIEQQQMKQITELKNRSYQKALLKNKDFNFIL